MRRLSSVSFWRASLRLLRRPFDAFAARRDMDVLARLTDRELQDIGLSRHDVRLAAHLPLSRDPTAFLAQTACERRHAARRQRQKFLIAPQRTMRD